MHETLWLNLFSKEQLNELAYWLNGLGIAPWERMPDGEDCEIARDLKESYLGRLVPLSRFCFLAEEGLHYSEGIIFSDHNRLPLIKASFPTDNVMFNGVVYQRI